MPTKSKRPALKLTAEELEQLRERAQSLSAPHREVHRAKILVRYLASETFTEIAQALRTPRRIVYKCVDKALAMGVESALQDVPHGRPGRTIQPEDRAWVVHLACSKPKDLGYAAELWTRRALAEHVRRHAVAQGHPTLVRAVKATVQRILAEEELQPQKVRYYLERRDPEFEAKMKEVLLVYREVATAPITGVRTAEGQPVYMVPRISRVCKHWLTRPRTCLRCLGCTRPMRGTTNTGAWERPPSWPAWTCKMAMSRRGSNVATGAGNLSICCRSWMPTTRPEQSSG